MKSINDFLESIFSPIESFVDGFALWRDFDGVSSRSQFWSFTLISWIIDAALRWIDAYFGWEIRVGTSFSEGDTSIGMLTAAYLIVSLIPMAAILTRRLHDADLSGWLAFTALIPFAGFPAVVTLSLLRSNPASRWIVSKNKTVRAAAVVAAKIVKK